ncbi:DUF5959 family protein [Streptomyces sp. NPDC058424]|uniref:DUF5959 family protein n=1 Tax=Streptomyces sp. NPDC058424 TaxID=3346491 RepID=UPI00366020D8
MPVGRPALDSVALAVVDQVEHGWSTTVAATRLAVRRTRRSPRCCESARGRWNGDAGPGASAARRGVVGGLSRAAPIRRGPDGLAGAGVGARVARQRDLDAWQQELTGLAPGMGASIGGDRGLNLVLHMQEDHSLAVTVHDDRLSAVLWIQPQENWMEEHHERLEQVRQTWPETAPP